MPRKRTNLIWGALFLLIVGFTIPSDNFPQPLEKKDKSLLTFIKVIEDTFIREDAERLTKLLPAKYKVELRMDLLPPDSGFFSPSQVFYIYQRIFQKTDTINFNLNKDEISIINPKDIILQARWSFRKRDDLKTKRLILYLSVYKQNNHWVIRRIKAKQLIP